MRLLKIDEQLIDLPNDTAIALDFSINDIADLDMKSGNRSNKFKVPYSQANVKAFGWANNVSSSTLKPYRIGDAILEQNGIQLIPRGNAIIEQSNSGIDVTVYDGNARLFQAIGSAKLSDLDLSDLDHLWNLTNIVASRLNTSGYIYPFVDWGFFPTSGNVLYTWHMMPCIFINTLVDKIFEAAGFTKSGAFLTGEFYNRLIIDLTFENGLEYSDEKVAEQLFRAFTTNTSPVASETVPLIYDAGHTPYKTWGTGTLNPIPFDNVDFDNGNNYNEASYEAEVQLPGKYIFETNIEITATATGPAAATHSQGSISATVTILVNGVAEKTVTHTLIAGTGYDAGGSPVIGVTDNITVATDDRFYFEGDVVTVQIEVTGEFNYWYLVMAVPTYVTDPASLDYELTDNSYFKNSFSSDIQPGGQLVISDLIGSMKQIDLLKAVANMGGIIFNTDRFSNNVEWHEFDEVIDNIPNAKDWSQKIDAKTKPTIDFKLGKYARVNYFKYSEQEEVLDQGIGYLTIDDETLEPETTIVTLPFGATDMVSRLSSPAIEVPFIDRYTSTGHETDATPIYGTWTKKQKQRILILDRQSQQLLQTGDGIDLHTGDDEGIIVESSGAISGDFDISDGVTTVNVTDNIPLCYFFIAGKDYNLRFGVGNGLLENFYVAQKSVMTYPKSVTDYFKLTEKDIAELDHFTPVFLNINNEHKNINGYFYINKIKQFRSDRLTQVNLIRI